MSPAEILRLLCLCARREAHIRNRVLGDYEINQYLLTKTLHVNSGFWASYG